MKKYSHVVALLRTRIAQGDYALTNFPAERQLAVETGVSYMTARRAVKELLNDGWIVRRPNGRLEISRTNAPLSPLSTKPAGNDNGNRHQLPPPRQIALLAPTYSSPNVEGWRIAIDQGVRRRGWTLRPVLYVHWDDPTLLDALRGFDASFLIPVAGAIPPRVLQRLKETPRLVVVDDDWSDRGFVSVQLFPPVFVQRLLDHFAGLGHARIGCLNTQPHDDVIRERIGQWKIWLAAHHLDGRLWDQPVPVQTTPFQAAYTAVRHAIRAKQFDVTALLCTTAPAAVGAMRALADCKLRPGRDVAVGVVNGEGYAQLLMPSVTALEPTDPAPYVATCLDWTANGDAPWAGPLLLQPKVVPLIVRETSCRVLKRGLRKTRAKA